jgi:hypothetical protein
MAAETRARDLNARIVSHELMLALIVAMQAVQLFWMSGGDRSSATLAYGFGAIAVLLWVRFLGLTVAPGLRSWLGRGVS